MENLFKFLLLGILTLPFAALVSDTLGRTSQLFLKVSVRCTLVSLPLAFMIGGLHQRPNVANAVTFGLLIWPILILVAKTINEKILWRDVWLSVPVMSWYLVNLSMQFYYPTDGGGGGLGFGLGLILGWAYMFIPFLVLWPLFLGIQALLNRSGEQVVPPKSDRAGG